MPVAALTARDDILVVGYAPDYSLERIAPCAYDRITDAILFSAILREDGSFPEESIAALPVSHFQEIKVKHGVSTHLCFGGWGRSGGFSEMTGDTSKRAAFINALVEWCIAHDFDGVDYDWEFPANREEHAAYSRLLEETAHAFRPHRLRVTVAVGHTQTLDVAAYEAVDAIHLMAYDMGVRHSTERDAFSAVRRLIRSGAPPDKIVLGLPFYGRRIDDQAIAMAYADILIQFNPKPNADEAGGFYFNHLETLRRKTRSALDAGLAGVMVWELSMDTHDDTSLLAAMEEEIGRRP